MLIVAGGRRALSLIPRLLADGHAVRMTTRGGRAAEIQAAGAEAWIGDPDRLVTLRAALENVTIACWLLGSLDAEPEQIQALHTDRLSSFARALLDTTVRGVVYEPHALSDGRQLLAAIADRSSVPWRAIDADLTEHSQWLQEAHSAIASILA